MRAAILALGCFAVFSSLASAQVFSGNLNLNPAASSLTVSGNLNGSAYTQQGAGSLTTTYSNIENVAFDATANTLQFFNASNAIAAISGNWAPGVGGVAGTAPANYGVHISLGGFIPVDAALRNFRLTVTSSVLNLIGGGASRTFALTQQFAVLQGDLDYNAGTFGTGTTSLTGQTGNNAAAGTGTFDLLGGNSFRVTLPIDTTIVLNFTANGTPLTATTRFVGSWQATGTLTSIPEPTTLALLGLATTGAAWAWRRNRQNRQANAANVNDLDQD